MRNQTTLVTSHGLIQKKPEYCVIAGSTRNPPKFSALFRGLRLKGRNDVQGRGQYMTPVVLKLAILLLLALICLCSCSLLPMEEELLLPPVVKSYERAQPTIFRVARGDLRQTERINVLYVPTVTESLSFPIGDVQFFRAYFNIGDTVKKGDLLISLDDSEFVAQIAELDRRLASNETEIENRRALYELDKKAAVITGDSTRVTAEFNSSILRLEEDAAIMQMQRDRLEKEQSLRHIFAGIDGVVTHIKTFTQGDVSIKDEVVVILTDKSDSVFVTTGGNAWYLKPGLEADIIIGNESFHAKVKTPEELGISNPKKDAAYLSLTEAATVSDRAYGAIEFTVDERTDVLYIHSNAICTVFDRNFVYTMENGVRTVKDVTIGLIASSYAEVIDGLSEGDEVLIRGRR